MCTSHMGAKLLKKTVDEKIDPFTLTLNSNFILVYYFLIPVRSLSGQDFLTFGQMLGATLFIITVRLPGLHKTKSELTNLSGNSCYSQRC